MRVLAVLALLALPSFASECRVVNLMPSFWQFWDQAKEAPRPQQIARFKEMVLEPNRSVYSADVLRSLTFTTIDEPIARMLDRIPPYIDAMRQLDARFARDLDLYVAGFRKAFPDFRCTATIYSLVSLGAFDGAGRTVDGRPALLFGIDVIARVQDEESLPVFFHHELFHLYQPQVNPTERTRALYWALWGEGLATYVGHALNPATPEHKVLGRPADLAERTRPLLPKLLPFIRKNLDSSAPEVHEPLFTGGRAKEYPSRAGYYVGYLIAKELARHEPLPRLARLSGRKLRDRMRAALISLERADAAATRRPPARRGSTAGSGAVPAPVAPLAPSPAVSAPK